MRILDRLLGRQATAPAETRFPQFFAPAARDEVVALDTETTSLDPRRAEILSIAALRVRNNRILASRPFSVLVKPEGAIGADAICVHHLRAIDVANGLTPAEAFARLAEFVGGRPLVGYYLDFDIAVLNRALAGLGAPPLPNRRIEVSGLYYDWAVRVNPALRLYGDLDLRFETILKTLHLPPVPRHDPLNDALGAAMMYLALKDRR